MDGDTMDVVEAFRRLALLQGVSLGSLRSGRRNVYRIVMASAMRSFAPHAIYSEGEVNDLLKAWLAGPGEMLSADHVELRRGLVDARLLARDGFGRQYCRTAATGEWARVLAKLEGIDLATVAREARRDEDERRALRKERWQRQQAERVAEAGR